MKLIKFDSLMSWTTLKESRQLQPDEYIEWEEYQETSPACVDTVEIPFFTRLKKAFFGTNKTYRHIYVSHRWITPEHPDPHGIQLGELKRRLNYLADNQQDRETTLVFYDYCSMPQLPRTPEEDAIFRNDLASLSTLLRSANKMIVLSEGYKDYKNRAWCFWELMVCERLCLFNDQQEIASDTRFKEDLSLLKIELEWAVNSFVVNSYEPRAAETESIAAIFQHLTSCRVTHQEDAAVIRQAMADYLNGLEMMPFGKLLIGVAKFFEITYTVGGGGLPRPIPCKPYFEALDWKRLPGRNGSDLSLFAVPEHAFRLLSLNGYVPMLCLKMPGVSDFTKFLQKFQKQPGWGKYVVSPITVSGQAIGDRFPTIEHVIYTMLVRNNGFAIGDECIIMPLTHDFDEFMVPENGKCD